MTFSKVPINHKWLPSNYFSKQKQKRSRQSSLASISQQGSQSSSGYNNNIEQKAFETASTKDDGSATYNFALVPANSGVVQQRLQNGSSMSLLGTHSVSAEALALQNRLGGVDVALNPLNPRSRSQRRYLSQTNVSRNNRISPTAETPLPSPSIHEVPALVLSSVTKLRWINAFWLDAAKSRDYF